ncbi:hypothetical protein LCGC14_1645210 [marine sediment metagenome]|uniref:Uncharacterized protein n=1 Tax=marine sediment metagenome TaxID=412755 RepID=A0A0F9IKZ6_9ZZZZ
MDDFECKIKVKPIFEWVNGEPVDEKDCPPCLIAPLSSYYLATLEDAGEAKLAGELKVLFEKGEVLTIAEKLDSIKTDVGDALSKQLRNLDCFAQSFKPD